MTLDYKSNTKTTDELKFVEYLGSSNNEDTYLLKLISIIDGKKRPVLKLLKNFEKPNWVTTPMYATHRQKKEYEKIDHCTEIMVRKSDEKKKMYPAIVASTKKANTNFRIRGVAQKDLLRMPMQNCSVWDLKSSPFAYGMDVPHEAYIKDWYIRNGGNSPWNVTMFDIEVNIEDPFKEHITHISISNEESSFLAISRERFYKHAVIGKPVNTAFGKLDRNGNPYTCDQDILDDIEYQYKQNVPNGEVTWGEKKREIKLYNTEIELIEETFKRLHEWKPDIVSIWNMNYDIPKIIKGYTRDIFERFQQWNTIPEEVKEQYDAKINIRMSKLFKDPSVPDNFAVFKYIVGKNKIETVLDNGDIKTKTFKFHEVWHVLKSSASFMFIDAMCLFHQIRSQEPAIDGGMSLDNVLTRVANTGKVKDDSRLVKRLWHIDTSSKKPAFYSCYGMFDTDSMCILDKKTEDLSSTGAAQLGRAHFSKYSALTHRLHLAFHFDIMNKGQVAGTKDPRLKPNPILGIGGGWIVTVPAYRKTQNGGKIIKENPNLNTSHFPHTYDLDEVAAYPRATVCGNVGKETTMGELVEIEGYEKEEFLKHNINIIVNKVNSFSYSTNMLGLPGFEELYNMSIEDRMKGMNDISSDDIETLFNNISFYKDYSDYEKAS